MIEQFKILLHPRKTYRRIRPNIRSHTSSLTRRSSKSISKDTVVRRALGGLTGAATVHENITDTVLKVVY